MSQYIKTTAVSNPLTLQPEQKGIYDIEQFYKEN
jgi:hypothetical protein